MDRLTITMDKERLRIELLLRSQPSLPQLMRQIRRCTSFAGMLGGQTVAAALLDRKEGCFDIVNLSVDERYEDTDIARELLCHMLDYVRALGGRYVEIGAGNGQARMFVLLQALGFRIVGVWHDYYTPATRPAANEQEICSRDMLRYRIDLQQTAQAP